MKIKLLTHVCLFFLFLAYLTSCKKEEVKPTVDETAVTNISSPKALTVEYKIYAASGNFKLNYIGPNAANKLVVNQLTINRMEHSISFDYVSGNTFKVQASNLNPSTKEVTVEVYINGILYNSGLANTTNGLAVAEAKVNL